MTLYIYSVTILDSENNNQVHSSEQASIIRHSLEKWRYVKKVDVCTLFCYVMCICMCVWESVMFTRETLCSWSLFRRQVSLIFHGRLSLESLIWSPAQTRCIKTLAQTFSSLLNSPKAQSIIHYSRFHSRGTRVKSFSLCSKGPCARISISWSKLPSAFPAVYRAGISRTQLWWCSSDSISRLARALHS